MQESFLHYIWHLQYFSKEQLRTTAGEVLEVVSTGTLNRNAGPDFSAASVRIDGIAWFGHVEIHVQSSQWAAHQHHLDPAYDNVILHVVWKDDVPIQRRDGTALPTMELAGRVEERLYFRYRQLVTSNFLIPCERTFRNVPSVKIRSALDRALTQRLERKATEVLERVEHNHGDWEETCYQLLAKNFGFRINAEPFLLLAKAVPFRIIKRQSVHLPHVEALLLGTAGMLEADAPEPYARTLWSEYEWLATKFELRERQLKGSVWKFLRLRPANFPTLRVAQLAALLCSRQNLFSAWMGSQKVHDLFTWMQVTPSPYWQRHYHFGLPHERPIQCLGRESMENVIVNTIVPVWVAHGLRRHEDMYTERALLALQELSAEPNAFSRNWQKVGMSISNSADSQGAIELFTNFCQQKLCLQCPIGNHLLQPHDAMD